MKYFKRFWNESRGDKYDAWGSSWWFFEVDSKGQVFRQIEQYDNGQVSRYDEQHSQDEFGGLAEKPLDLNDFEQFEISQEEFEDVWKQANN